MTDIRGSEPRSRSWSSKVRRVAAQVRSPSARRRGSSYGGEFAGLGVAVVGAQLLFDMGTLPAAGRQGDDGGVEQQSLRNYQHRDKVAPSALSRRCTT